MIRSHSFAIQRLLRTKIFFYFKRCYWTKVKHLNLITMEWQFNLYWRSMLRDTGRKKKYSDRASCIKLIKRLTKQQRTIFRWKKHAFSATNRFHLNVLVVLLFLILERTIQLHLPGYKIHSVFYISYDGEDTETKRTVRRATWISNSVSAPVTFWCTMVTRISVYLDS